MWRSLQIALLQRLGAKRPELRSIDDGATRLRAALATRRCLLVVDHVWTVAAGRRDPPRPRVPTDAPRRRRHRSTPLRSVAEHLDHDAVGPYVSTPAGGEVLALTTSSVGNSSAARRPPPDRRRRSTARRTCRRDRVPGRERRPPAGAPMSAIPPPGQARARSAPARAAPTRIAGPAPGRRRGTRSAPGARPRSQTLPPVRGRAAEVDLGLAGGELIDDVAGIRDRPGQTVELGDDQSVARAARPGRLGRPVGLRSTTLDNGRYGGEWGRLVSRSTCCMGALTRCATALISWFCRRLLGSVLRALVGLRACGLLRSCG
jgi:hypothetical protein